MGGFAASKQLSNFNGRGHDKRFDLVHSLRAAFHSRILGAFQHPDHLNLSNARLWLIPGNTGQHGPCSHLSISWVALAQPAARGTVRTVDLDYPVPLVSQVAHKSGSI